MELHGARHDVAFCKLKIVAGLLKLQIPVSPSKSEQSYLVTSDGHVLFLQEALGHLARMRPDLCLYGQTFTEMSLVNKALRETEANYTSIITAMQTMNKSKQEAAQKLAPRLLSNVETHLEPHLADRTFIVGERMTIADIDCALSLHQAAEEFNVNYECLPHVSRWMKTIMKHPGVVGHVAETKKPSQQHPPAAKPAAEPEAPMEDNAQPPKKKKNPLEDLPPSTMDLDEWKRKYSNCKDLRGIAMPWFWSHFDPEGWSFWYVRYDRLQDENKLAFKAANMLDGFLQRVDPSFRRYSFAVMNVVAVSGYYELQGVWLIRGKTLPMELTDHPSFAYYKFTNLEPLENPAQKQLVEAYWCDDDKVEGHPIESCKVWK